MSYSGKFKDKNNNLHPVTSVLYGTCDTAAATAAKVVTCSDFDALMTGVTIRVKFDNANTAASPTVNINSTGAKSVYRFGSTAPVDGNSWNAGEVVELVYDGTSFFMTGADDLSVKQNATDNSLQTTDKTIPGAINEVRSGLINLDNEVNGDATTYPYADVITIEDAVPSNLADCSVKIEPVQDLHGYDKPWVGGAYKNKAKPKNYSSDSYDGTTFSSPLEGAKVIDDVVLPAGTYVASIKMLSVPSTQRTLTFYKTGDVELAYFVNLNEKTVGQVYTTTFTLSEESTVYAKSWATGGGEWKMQMQLEAGETATAFAPYTNLCPISGNTEVDVQKVGGKNWFDGSYMPWSIPVSTIMDSNGRTAVIPICGGHTYTISKLANSNRFRVFESSKIPEVGDNLEVLAYTTVDYKYTVTVSNSAKYLLIYVSNSSEQAEPQMQVELGDTGTTFEQYKGNNQYTIALGSTIYGGTVDFDSGVMTVDRKGVDLGLLDFTYDESQRFIVVISDMKSASIREAHFITSCYLTIDDGRPYSQVPDFSAYAGWGGTAMMLSIHDSRYSDAATYKTAITGQTICYELATPTTIQLTPQQIQLLKGQNTLTASTGKISVTVNGVSGAIGAVQEQVNDHEERIDDVESGLTDVDTTETLAYTYPQGATIGSHTRVIRRNNVISITYEITPAEDISAWTSIIDLTSISDSVDTFGVTMCNATDNTQATVLGTMWETHIGINAILTANKKYNIYATIII